MLGIMSFLRRALGTIWDRCYPNQNKREYRKAMHKNDGFSREIPYCGNKWVRVSVESVIFFAFIFFRYTELEVQKYLILIHIILRA